MTNFGGGVLELGVFEDPKETDEEMKQQVILPRLRHIYASVHRTGRTTQRGTFGACGALKGDIFGFVPPQCLPF